MSVSGLQLVLFRWLKCKLELLGLRGACSWFPFVNWKAKWWGYSEGYYFVSPDNPAKRQHSLTSYKVQLVSSGSPGYWYGEWYVDSIPNLLSEFQPPSHPLSSPILWPQSLIPFSCQILENQLIKRIPFLPGKANFWGQVDQNGYYIRSPDFYDIVEWVKKSPLLMIFPTTSQSKAL